MNLEEIRAKHNKLHYVHSYIDNNSCEAEWDEASKAIDYLLYRVERYKAMFDYVERFPSAVSNKDFKEVKKELKRSLSEQ